MNEIRLRSVELGSRHVPLGKTQTWTLSSGLGRQLAAPRRLEVVRYDGTPGVYLLHLDAEGQSYADTWHETLEDAFDQAEFEFGVTSEEWQVPD